MLNFFLGLRLLHRQDLEIKYIKKYWFTIIFYESNDCKLKIEILLDLQNGTLACVYIKLFLN